MNSCDIFCLRGQGNSIQCFYNLHSHSTWTLTKVYLGVTCTPGVRHELVHQTALREGSIREHSQVPLSSWQGPRTSLMDLLTSEEQRMIRMLCCHPQGEAYPSLHDRSPTGVPVAYGCHSLQSEGNQVAEGRRGTKPTKFILCLFSMSWIVLSENS